MAPIVQGSVSGILPDRRLFAVQYPGYPASIDRAVETLGGEAGIAKVRASDAGYLELKFRPEDPYSHPAFGEPHRTSNLLLRISKTQNKDSTSSQEEVDAEIVAHVDDTYVFDGMADYQYVLAVHSDGSKEKKSKQSKQRFGGLMDMEEEELMILVPPLFSIKDMPEETLLRPSDRSKAKPTENSMDFTPCFGLDFKAKDVPKAVNWEVKLVKDSEEWSLHKAMVKCFEERPIWVKTTLVQKLHDQGLEPTPSMLKRLLFRLAYNFLYGPFRTLWIKNGYDPRKDPASRKYQMLDFRVPRLLRYSGQTQSSRRDAENASWREECAFKVVPKKKFSFFQLYDLEDDFIKTQIEKPPERTTCSESTGWFRRGTLERMRQHVRLRFLALIPGDAARAIEETETKNFERFRNKTGWRGGNKGAAKSVANNVDTDAMEDPGAFPEPLFAEGDITEAPPAAETGNAGSQSEMLAGDDDEEEEEEDDEVRPDEDDEEEDEESEEDEDNSEQNKSVEVPAHPSHDIPKNYLQALLEKFPQGSRPNKAGETDEDTEYAIYEQDEDDDYTF